jgi:hypothetical protein
LFLVLVLGLLSLFSSTLIYIAITGIIVITSITPLLVVVKEGEREGVGEGAGSLGEKPEGAGRDNYRNLRPCPEDLQVDYLKTYPVRS